MKQAKAAVKAIVSIRDDVVYIVDGRTYSTWQREELLVRYTDGSFEVIPKRLLIVHSGKLTK